MSGRASRRVGWLIALAALLFAIAWWPGRTYFGYCHAEGRYLTDAEKIDSAIRDTMASYPPTLASLGNYRPKNPIPYASREEFLRINPDCCSLTDIERKGQHVTFLARLDGTNSTYVTVKYLVRFRDENGNEVAEPSATFRAITNCGNAWSGI